MKKFIFLLLLLLAICQILEAGRVQKSPRTYTQPDGTEIKAFVSGDEFYHYIEDESGYTLVKEKDGYIYYGVEKDGEVISSGIKAGTKKKARHQKKC